MSNNIKGITVEIGGNTGPLNTALKDVNKTSRSLQGELKEVNKQLKFNPSSTVLLKQKQELLAKQISNTKEKLETLKEAEKQTEQQFNEGKIGEDKYRAVQREVEKTESQLKNLEKQAKTTSSILGIKFENAGTKIKDTGDKISGVGSKFAPLSAAAAGVGVAAVKAADDFETGMAKVSTIADTTQVPVSQLKQSVMDLSNETGIGTAELTDGLYQTISAGVQTRDAISVLNTAVKTAKGGFTDTSTAIDTLTSAMNAYHMKAADAAKVSDILIATQNIGKTTVGELGQSLGNVIPTAAAAHIKFTDLMGSIAELTKQGMPTSEAITGIKAAISNVIKPSSEASKAAQKLGLDFSEAHMKNVGLPAFMQEVYEKTGGNISVMSQLFGSVEGLNAVTALTGKNQKDFAKTLDGVSKAAGTTNQAFKKMESTGATSAEKAMNSLKNAAAKLGEALAPIAEKIASIISQIAKKLQALSPAQQQMIAKVLLATAAIAPLIILIGKLHSGIGNVMDGISFLIKHPIVAIILAVIAAVAALVVGIKHLWDTNKGFRTAVTSIWTGIKNTLLAIGKWFSGPFVNFFKTAVNSIKSFFTSIPAFFTGIWNGIKSAATTAWNGICSAVMAIVTPFVAAIQGPFNTLKSGISNILNGIKTIFTGVWTIIKNVVLGIVLLFIDLITGDFSKLGSDLSHILNNIKNAFSTIWNGIKSVVTGIAKVLVGALGTIFKGGVSVLQSIGNGLKTFFSGLWNNIKSTAISLWNGLLSFFSGLPAKFSGFMQGVGNAIIHGFDSAIAFIKNLPSQMLQWGKDMIQGLIDGIKGMVGKVGDAVKGVGKKIRSVLHFSVPDEGPLVDYETWMPDFMEGLANGILNSMYKVTDAMQQVSSSMANTMLTISSGPQVQAAMTAAYGGYYVPVSVQHNSGSSTPVQSTDNETGKVEVNQYFQGKVPSPAEHARLSRLGIQQAILKIKKG